MKARRPKSRTLADFLKRGADAEVSSEFHDDPNAIESVELAIESASEESKATKPKHRTAKRKQSPKSKPTTSDDSDFSPEKKKAERASLIEQSESLEHQSKAVGIQAQATELLDGILDIPDYERCARMWAQREPVCWDGAWLGAVAPMAAAAWRKYQRPMLVVLSQHQDVETVARDLEFYIEHNCEVFPPAADEIAEDALQQLEVIQRLQVLSRLQRY
jgi:hypothetical protein